MKTKTFFVVESEYTWEDDPDCYIFLNYGAARGIGDAMLDIERVLAENTGVMVMDSKSNNQTLFLFPSEEDFMIFMMKYG